MVMNSSLPAELESAIAGRDRRRALAASIDAVDSGAVSIIDLYGLLSEMLVRVGASWQQGTVEVWEEHLITGIVRSVVEAMALRVEDAAPQNREATVVLAAPQDEYHDLGLRMLADRFTLSGWRSYFLGASVPLSELVRAVSDLKADGTVLSASTHFHRVRLKAYVTELAKARPELKIWVGGPAFAIESDDWPPAMVLDPRTIPQPGQV